MRPSSRVEWLRKRWYPTEESRDPVSRFFRMVEGRFSADDTVLDLGAGAGQRNRHRFRGRCARLVGVDLDYRVGTNDLVDLGVLADLTRLPITDDACDLAFSVYVLEHVEEAERLVGELYRVLKPGGLFLALTPNRYHYVTVLSLLTPTSFHKWYNRLRGREVDDTFPAHYRLNTGGALRSTFTRGGFQPVFFDMIEVCPNYLLFSVPTFLLGAAYERLVNSVRFLSTFRVNIACAFRKPLLAEARAVAPEAGEVSTGSSAGDQP